MTKFNRITDCGTYRITGKQYGIFSVGTEVDSIYPQPMISVTVGNNTSSAVFFDYDKDSLKAAKKLVKLIKQGIKERR